MNELEKEIAWRIHMAADHLSLLGFYLQLDLIGVMIPGKGCLYLHIGEIQSEQWINQAGRLHVNIRLDERGEIIQVFLDVDAYGYGPSIIPLHTLEPDIQSELIQAAARDSYVTVPADAEGPEVVAEVEAEIERLEGAHAHV